MARPTLFTHRKFARLADDLGSEALALGHLEFIWSAASQSGDDLLGDARDVELAARWKGKPGELCHALLTAGGAAGPGFIDERGGLYFIHDLFDHAPDYVRRRAEREASRVASGRTLSEIRSEAGKKGGRPLAGKQTEPNEKQMNFTSLPAESKRKANDATPSPTPSPTPLTTSKGVPVFVGDPPVAETNVGEGSPTALFDLSNGSNGNGKHEPGPAKPARSLSATLEAEIAWRVSRVWEVHLAAWRNYRQDRTGVRPKRDPQPHPADILKPIRLALLAHDKHLLGPDDRERWERESVVRAAGVGIFHDPFLTAKTGQNDLSSGGTEYLEHWRPWKPQRGKADPVPRFAEIYFNIREVGDAVRS